MSLYNIIDKHMLLPIGDMVYRSNINTQWERLKRTEFVSKTDLTELQNTKLSDTEEHHLREEVQVHPCSFVPTNENGAYNVLPR